jgi:hypothetical protein
MWQAKAKTGTHEAVYRTFEAEFAARPVEVAVAVAVAPKAPLVRKTAEEKAAEVAAKKTAATAAKAAAVAAKAAAAAEKAAEKKAAVPKAAVKVPAKAAAAVPVAVAAPAGVKPGPKKKAAEPTWTCPNDDNVYPWTYKGVKLLRNFTNQIWSADEDGGCGDWKGMYLPAEDRIDDSAADPFADEDEE